MIVGLGCEVSFAAASGRGAGPGHAGRPVERQRRKAGPPAPDAQHPGARGDHPDGRGGRAGGLRAPARGQRLDPDRAAGVEDQPGDGVRRLRRQLGRDGQPGAGRRGRPARRAGRDGVPRRDDRDLRRRAPAHPPRGLARGRREAGRADQVVGVVHRDLRRRDQQQPVAGQQGRRPDDDLREVAGRPGQGRVDRPGRRRPLRRAGRHARAWSSWTRPATTRPAPPA